jgi:glycosyltransferase involved in cell wall biosynthesis
MTKVCVVASDDPSNIKLWSGTPYHMVQALAGEFENLVVIKKPYSEFFIAARSLFGRVASKLSLKNIWFEYIPGVAWWGARSTVKQIREINPDVVVVIAYCPLSGVLSKYFPTIHISDATFCLMDGYYESFTRLPAVCKANGEALERTAVTASKLSLLSSAWAADSAISHYGGTADQVHFIPWGCNFLTDPNEGEAIDLFDSKTCHLLFIGMDWERKGGSLAVATVEVLRARGFDAKLHVVGTAPADAVSSEGIEYHGVLSKANEAQRTELREIMLRSAFLFLPTRQDCTPMVFSEGNAFGMPGITTDTGGVSSVVVEGVNGHLLPLTAGPKEYADLIEAAWVDQGKYIALRKSSRRQYEQVLNWKTWARQSATLIRAALRT